MFQGWMLAQLKGLSVGLLVVGTTLLVALVVGLPRGPVARAKDRALAKTQRELTRAGLDTRPEVVLVAQAVGGVVACAFCAAGLYPAALVAVIVARFAPASWIDRHRRARVTRITMDVDTFLTKLANALRVMPSIGDALLWIEDVLDGPLKIELVRVNREMRLGQPLDEALLTMGDRCESPTLAAALTGVLIGRRIGGDLPRNLETMATSLREMARLEGVLRSKTAEGRAQLWVLGSVPIGLSLILDQVQPGFFDPLAKPVLGWIVAGVAVGLWASAIVVARKVLDVEL